MKKNNILGLASLLLFAVVLSFFVSALAHGPGVRLDSVLHTTGLVLLILSVAAVFFASKGRRLRMALLLLAAAAGSVLLNRLHLSRGTYLLAVLGIMALYLLGCILYNSLQFRRTLRPLNEAALAYQKDHDGEAFLAALDRYVPALPKGGAVKREGIGTITIQEHFDCERIEVLGKLGRLEERQELIQRLRRETRSPGLPAWLDERESEFGIDSQREKQSGPAAGEMPPKSETKIL